MLHELCSLVLHDRMMKVVVKLYFKAVFLNLLTPAATLIFSINLQSNRKDSLLKFVAHVLKMLLTSYYCVIVFFKPSYY